MSARAGLPRYQIVGQTRGRTGGDKGERESAMIGAISESRSVPATPCE